MLNGVSFLQDVCVQVLFAEAGQLARSKQSSSIPEQVIKLKYNSIRTITNQHSKDTHDDSHNLTNCVAVARQPHPLYPRMLSVVQGRCSSDIVFVVFVSTLISARTNGLVTPVAKSKFSLTNLVCHMHIWSAGLVAPTKNALLPIV